MLFEAAACKETVSILEAVIFGAGEACIDIGVPSLLGGVAGFIGCVLLIRLVAMLALRRIFSRRPHKPASQIDVPRAPEADRLQPLPYESPIKSTGAWGRKRT